MERQASGAARPRPRSAWSRIEFEPFDREGIANLDAKQEAARSLAAEARSGQAIGAGSGSSAYLAIHAIADRVAAGELADVTLIPTSIEVQITIARRAAETPGLALGDLAACRPDWLFDGADEVDPEGNLIKGRGGALFREKLMFRATEDRRILIDPTKRVDRLGQAFPVPVEVAPTALPVVAGPLADLGATEATIRTGTGKDGPVITESGSLLLDCHFDRITPDLEAEINQITGVIESGLFQGYAPTVVGG